MKQIFSLFLVCIAALTGCKKDDGKTTVTPPAALLTMTIDSVPFNATLVLDTVILQMDTQIGSAYTNPISFDVPHKRMTFIARNDAGFRMTWYLNDYNNPEQGTCLRNVGYKFNETSTDYITAFGTKFRSGFALIYLINEAPIRYFEGSGGDITITNCDEANKLVSGTFNVYTDNHDYPNEHHILQGTFTNVPYRTTTVAHYNQSITATVNGAPWVADGTTSVIGKTADFGIINKGFRATGVSIVDNSEIEISVFEARNGNQGNCIRSTTFLDFKRSTDTVFTNGYALICSSVINYITPDGNYSSLDSSAVHITDCNEANSTISGTFSYYGKTTNNLRSVVITNGVFTDLHYTVN